jgi:uncharacterized protein YndB with AHSA1/START domain
VTKKTIQYDFSLKQSPERVWKALTTPEQIARWLMPNDFVPKLGHKFTFKREPMPQLKFDGISHCEVIELDPPAKLAYTFVGGPLNTVIRFRLEPEGQGTHLYFEHSGFDADDPIQMFSFQAMGQGWSQLGKNLESLVAADSANPR